MELQIMRFDTSMDSLNVTRSESVTDLNTEINGLPHPRRASTGHARNDENFISAPPKSFGIGKHGPYLLYYIWLILMSELYKYIDIGTCSMIS
jgi:hypothetical protein